MKKVLAIIAAMSLITLASCGHDITEKTAADISDNEVSETTEATEATSEAAETTSKAKKKKPVKQYALEIGSLDDINALPDEEDDDEEEPTTEIMTDENGDEYTLMDIDGQKVKVATGLEKKIDEITKSLLQDIYITGISMPETALTPPTDWTSLTKNGLTLKLPDGFTEEAEDDYGMIPYTFKYNKVKGTVSVDTASEAEKAESSKKSNEALLEDYEKTKELFAKFGLDYDGTEHSLYRNLLAITRNDIENADDEVKNDLSSYGIYMMFYEKAYTIEKDGSDIYVFQCKKVLDENGQTFYAVYIFNDDGKEEFFDIQCSDLSTALKIAGSAEISY